MEMHSLKYLELFEIDPDLGSLFIWIKTPYHRLTILGDLRLRDNLISKI
jgi:hypothetical protein